MQKKYLYDLRVKRKVDVNIKVKVKYEVNVFLFLLFVRKKSSIDPSFTSMYATFHMEPP